LLDEGDDEHLGRLPVAVPGPPRHGSAYPAELAEDLEVGRTNVSNHLACLRGCGLVRSTREGRQVRYELVSSRLAHALAELVALDLEVEPGHADLDGRR
jgi:ArsR family transcriptional regulator, cadmium/lead-responsive transcriptional repressor